MMVQSPALLLRKHIQQLMRYKIRGAKCNQIKETDGKAKSIEIDVQSLYESKKKIFLSKQLPKDINVNGVFACNELNLEEVDIYGFDYDYTLAHYKPSLNDLIYNLGREMLVKNFQYPNDISNLEYLPEFAIRGLHYDIEKGVLLKLDSFLQIQSGCVYRGLTKITEDECEQLYENRKLPYVYVEGTTKGSHQKIKAKMFQIPDLFAVPEICLLCNVAQYFESKNIAYSPEILFDDIKSCIQACHAKMHQIVIQNTGDYIEKNPILPKYLEKLVNAGKKLFLITNSPFLFVNKGMTYLVGNDWRNYFDVIIVQARKPKFFSDTSRPIRVYDEKSNTYLWDRVSKLEKGKLYFEGSVQHFQHMTGWTGDNVLYFGDHPYSDLQDVSLALSWRTGAIIYELAREINTLNDKNVKADINWMQMLSQLIEDVQDIEGENAQKYLKDWKSEREILRQKTKEIFNKQFGSVFRTYSSQSYFSRRLFRFADVYTSTITNLYGYSTNHIFYTRRGVMPHEYSYDFM